MNRVTAFQQRQTKLTQDRYIEDFTDLRNYNHVVANERLSCIYFYHRIITVTENITGTNETTLPQSYGKAKDIDSMLPLPRGTHRFTLLNVGDHFTHRHKSRVRIFFCVLCSKHRRQKRQPKNNKMSETDRRAIGYITESDTLLQGAKTESCM